MFSKKAKRESSSHSKFLIHYIRSHPLSTERRKNSDAGEETVKLVKKENTINTFMCRHSHKDWTSPEEWCMNHQERESELPRCATANSCKILVL